MELKNAKPNRQEKLFGLDEKKEQTFFKVCSRKPEGVLRYVEWFFSFNPGKFNACFTLQMVLIRLQILRKNLNESEL